MVDDFIAEDEYDDEDDHWPGDRFDDSVISTRFQIYIDFYYKSAN